MTSTIKKCANDSCSKFTEKKVCMTNKHIKKCYILSVISKMQIKQDTIFTYLIKIY